MTISLTNLVAAKEQGRQSIASMMRQSMGQEYSPHCPGAGQQKHMCSAINGA